MAISDEITRLQNAKAALKTAINAKNDSSHQIDDETLDDYAGFVDLIHDALPAAYTELEYIESSGTQYIDNIIKPNKDYSFEIKYKHTAPSGYQTLFAVYDGASGYSYGFMAGSVSNGNYVYSGTGKSFTLSYDTSTIYTLFYDGVNNKVYRNGTEIADFSNLNGFSGITNVAPRLFQMVSGEHYSYSFNYPFKGYCYNFKVYDENNTLVRNLVPARRNSDNEVGMYDKVGGTFYTNAGTGEFIAPAGSGGGSATLVTKTITENGTYDAEDDSADGYSEVTVNVQPPQEAPSKDVNFYDYDGKILYSYTASEFAQLTALPANPTHTGLTSQGWNWTLADAKAQVTAVGACDIGQMYITDDGKTRLYCHFEDAVKHFYFGLGVNGTLLIDWGDGTTSTMTGSNRGSVTRTEHTYATGGDYVITITVSSGNFAFFGTSNYGYLFSKSDVNSANIHTPNLACLKKVELGSNVYFGNYSFCRCSNLEYVTIPSDMPSSVGTYVFYYCYNLKHVTIPTKSSSPITSLTNYMFYYAYSLQSISLPKTITSIGNSVFNSSCAFKRFVMPSTITSVGTSISYSNYCITKVYISTSLTEIKTTDFYRCYSLSKLVVPASVTSIATKAFQDCYGMKEYHFKSTTPPTLDNTDAFANMQSDCVIYVPSAKLNDYKTASNWSTYASQMVGE